MDTRLLHVDLQVLCLFAHSRNDHGDGQGKTREVLSPFDSEFEVMRAQISCLTLPHLYPTGARHLD
jgi:hypothetical protein